MPQDYFVELATSSVFPADNPYGSGVVVRDGLTEPFVVQRGWSGPGGHYLEQWSIRRGGRDVIYESPARWIFIRGPQAVSRHSDTVTEPIALEPGTYQLAFIVEGRFMGSAEIEVHEAGTAAA